VQTWRLGFGTIRPQPLTLKRQDSLAAAAAQSYSQDSDLAGEARRTATDPDPLINGLDGPLGSLAEQVVDWFISAGPARPARTLVPDLRQLPVDEARHSLSRCDLRMKSVRLTEHPAPVMGIVVEQNPEPGTRVRRNSVVTVSVQHPPAPG
jgi:hypothetical protein